MDDIARDPNPDGVASVEDSDRLRRKGPIDELAVRGSPSEGGADIDDTQGPRATRLPVVLPLPATDALDEDPAGEDPQGEDPADAASDGVLRDDSPIVSADDAADLERDLEDGGPGDGAPTADESEAKRPEPAPDDGARTDSASTQPRPDPLDEVLPEVAEPITDPDRLARVVLGLLLTVREGLTVLRLAQTCETTQEAVRGALARIQAQLGASGFPLELTGHGESLKLWTTPDIFPYLEKVKGIKKNERLSPAALETLAVVAYRQPVFRAEIEAIRGVKVGPMLRTLLDCKLVKIVGRADVPGRPLQYGTTQQFLDRFGLATIQDLPSVKEFKGLQG